MCSLSKYKTLREGKEEGKDERKLSRAQTSRLKSFSVPVTSERGLDYYYARRLYDRDVFLLWDSQLFGRNFWRHPNPLSCDDDNELSFYSLYTTIVCARSQMAKQRSRKVHDTIPFVVVG